MKKYHVAADASVMDYQGLGWAIITDTYQGLTRHKAIARRLVKKNSSTLMELMTVHAVMKSLPNDVQLDLVNDCQMMHDLYFWESVNWLNSKKVLTLEAKELRALYELAKEKNIVFTVYGKDTHPHHKECDLNCHRFREELNRNGKMVHLLMLTPDYKAIHISTHFNLIKAQEAANQLSRRRIATGLGKRPLIFAQCRDIGETVKDMKGRVYEVVG